ncbi:MAG: metal ABC transporter substrate-binding protein [Solirubrobacteraceae bacterium]|nr:metal ABC transporter substrate-binding protein [Solirubrobacteraceae bacterium]
MPQPWIRSGRGRRGALALLAAAAAALVLAGCGNGPTRGERGLKPLVLTTFTVLADMTRQVAGDRVEVASITRPGTEIHGYEPTPGDLKRAAGADLVLENGLDLERWFEQFIDRAEADRATLSDGVTTIPIRGASEYAGKPNPHAWMSTANAEIYIDNIRKALTELDPEGRDEYARRAVDYKSRIRKVGEEVRRDLADLPRAQRALVTCEGAFSYLARDLDLEERYLWPVNADQQGTPRQVADLITFVRDREVPAIFCETTVSDKSQRQVAREAGSRLGGNLYVDSLSKPDGPVPSYLDLLRVDVETIARGLKGDAR